MKMATRKGWLKLSDPLGAERPLRDHNGSGRYRALRGAVCFIAAVLGVQSLTRITIFVWKLICDQPVFGPQWTQWTPLVAIPLNHTCYDIVPTVLGRTEFILTWLDVLTLSFNIALMFGVYMSSANLLWQWITYTELQIWCEVLTDFVSLVAMFCPVYHFGVFIAVLVCNIKALVLAYFVWIVRRFREEVMIAQKKERIVRDLKKCEKIKSRKISKGEGTDKEMLNGVKIIKKENEIVNAWGDPKVDPFAAIVIM